MTRPERDMVPTRKAANRAPRVAGQLRLTSPGRAYPHSTWRVVLSEPHLALVIAELLGNQVQSPRGEEGVEFVIDATEIELLLDGAEAVQVSWYHGTRRCGSVASSNPACTCPAGFAARKQAARSGRGCIPRVTVLGRLARAPQLGIFEFVSGNWRFAEEAAVVVATLRQRRRPAHAVLQLAQSDHTLPSGRRVLDTRASLMLCQARAHGTP
jgi:hypothetical protein